MKFPNNQSKKKRKIILTGASDQKLKNLAKFIQKNDKDGPITSKNENQKPEK